MGDDASHLLGGIGRLEHVIADELVEIADRLPRYGLVEQLHRLLGLDAEQAPKLPGVIRKDVVDLRAAGPQPTAQVRQVGAEVGEVCLDRQLLRRGDKEPVRLAGPVLLVEHLRQRDGLVESRVGEDAEHNRVVPVVAQPDRTRAAGGLDPLGLVVAFDVAAQRAFPGVGAGGLVVQDALRGQQQRGERIDQGGLAAADVAGEQRGGSLGRQAPDSLVECPPVEHLEPMQPVARPSVLVAQLSCGEQLITHRRHRPDVSPLRRSRPACRRSPRASARPRTP